MFCTPTEVMTARTAPPAITPVPSGAGLSSTMPEPKRPSTWCGTVVWVRFTLMRFFLAASIPLRMACGTSFALPEPYPTMPAEGSPTTTSAANDMFLPPLTTLVTRLMATTWSFRFRLPASILFFVVTAIYFFLEDGTSTVSTLLELQSCFSCCIRDCLHSSVINVAPTVEDDLGHALGFGLFGDFFADLFGCRQIAAGLLGALFAFVGAGGEQGLAFHVVDELDIDVLSGAIHVQAWTLGRARDLHANAAVDLAAVIVLRNLRNHKILFFRSSRFPGTCTG